MQGKIKQILNLQSILDDKLTDADLINIVKSNDRIVWTWDSVNRKLEASLTPLAITDVTVDSTHPTIAAFVADNYTGTEFQEGDSVILTNATDGIDVYMHVGTYTGTVSDFQKVNVNNIDNAYIRSLFNATAPLIYNPSTGTFSIQKASSTQDGYLAKEDFAEFEGKSDIHGSGSDNAITRWDGTGNIQNSGVTLSDSADMTGVMHFVSGNGTALLPTYSFINDTDTGIYNSFNDTIAIATGGVNQMVISPNLVAIPNASLAMGTMFVVSKSLSRVGINTGSPTATLHVDGTLRFQNTGTPDGVNYVLASDGVGNASWKDVNTFTTDRGSEQYIFKTITANGTTNTIVAEQNNDTLNLVGHNGVQITLDPLTDTVTFSIDSLDMEWLEDAIGNTVQGTNGIDVQYNDTTGKVVVTNIDRGSMQNIFKQIAVGGSSTVILSTTNNDTLTFIAGSNISISPDAVGKTITISSNGVSNEYIQDVIGSTLLGTMGVDTVYDDTNNQLIITNTDRGTTQHIFKTISVAGQSNIVAANNNDFLTFVAGSNVTITTDPNTRSIIINSSAISTEDVEDIVGAMVTSNNEDGISVTYNDNLGKLDFFNLDKGSAQPIFKQIAVQSDTVQSNVVAGNNNDTVTFVSGNGILLTTNPTNKQVIISTKNGNINNGFAGHIAFYLADGNTVDDATTLFWDNAQNRLGVNTVTPTNTLDVAGDVRIQLVQNGSTSDRHLIVENGVVKYRNSNQLRSDIGAGTMSSFNIVDTNNVFINILDNKFVKFNTTNQGINAVWTATTDGSSVVAPYVLTLTNTDKGSDQSIFKRILVASNPTILASTNNDALTFEAGTNISISTDATNKKITISGTNLSIEEVQDIIGEMFNANVEDGVTVDYFDNTGKLNITNTDKGSGQNIFKSFQVPSQPVISATTNNDAIIFKAGANMTIQTNAATKEITFTATTPVISAEEVQDILGDMISGNIESGIDVTYDDNLGKLNLTNIDKGSSQFIFKNIAVFGHADNIIADSNNDTLTFRAGTSIILTPDTDNDQITISVSQEGIEDFVGAMVSDNQEDGISVTYDDVNGKLNFVNTDRGSLAYSFRTIELSGAPGTGVNATSSNDTLKLAKGIGIDLQFNQSTKTITIAADTSNFVSNFTFRDGDGTDVIVNNNKFVQFLSGNGMNVDFSNTSIGNSSSPFQLTFTNTDRGSTQNIFKNIQVNGINQFAATQNNDALNFVAGAGVTITANAGQRSITIDAGAGGVNTGVANRVAYYPSNGSTIDDASSLYWDNVNGRLGINNTSPLYGLDLVGSARISGLQPNADTDARIMVIANNNVVATKTIQELLTAVGNGTMNSFKVRDTNNVDKTIINDNVIRFAAGGGMDVIFTGAGDGSTGLPYNMKIENIDRGSAQNIFKTIQKVGDPLQKVIADSNSDTFYLEAGNNMNITFDQSTSTIRFDSIATGGGGGSITQEQVEDYVGAMLLNGTQTGIMVNYTDNSNSNPGWLNFINTDRGTNQNIFKNILRVNDLGATLNTISAANNNDTLRFHAGTNMTLVFDETTNTITFNAAGGTVVGGADNQTLAEVLVEGNSTGTNSILVENNRGLITATSNSSMLFNNLLVGNGAIPEAKSASIGTSEIVKFNFDAIEMNLKERLLFINRLPMLGIYNPTTDSNILSNPYHANYVQYQDTVIDQYNGCFLITLDTQEASERQQVLRVPIKTFLDPLVGSGSGGSYSFNISDSDANTATVYSSNNIRMINGVGIDVDILSTTSPIDIRVTNTDRGSDQYIYKRIYVDGKPDFLTTNNNNDRIVFVEGNGINIDIDPIDRKVIISSTLVGSGSGVVTEEDIVDYVAASLGDGFGIDIVYNDNADQIIINNNDRGSSQNIFKTFNHIVTGNITQSIVASSNTDAIGITSSGGVNITFDETNKIIDFSLASGISLTVEDVQDIIGAALVDGFGIDTVYNDAANQIVINNTDAGSAQNIFKTVTVKNKPESIVAASNNDNLVLVEGTGISMSVNDTTNEITISNNVLNTTFEYIGTSTNTAPTDLVLNSTVADITTTVGTTKYFDLSVIATDTNDYSQYYSSDVRLAVYNQNGTAHLVSSSIYQTDTINTFSVPVFFSFTVNTNNQLVITVTGGSGRTIKWIARGKHIKNQIV